MSPDPRPAVTPEPSSREARRGRRVVAMLALGVALGLVAALAVWLAASLAGSDDARGAAGSHPSSPALRASAETPAASPSLRPSLTPVDPGVDPPDLPRPPGSTVVAFEAGIDGEVHWTLTENVTRAAALDEVREHYRAVLRDGGWLVGDVGYANGVWSFAASRGAQEVQLEIAPSDDSVHTTVFLSDTTSPAVTTGPTHPPHHADDDHAHDDDD